MQKQIQNSYLAFSLVEIMVALLVVGSLAGIFVSSLSGTRDLDELDRGVQELFNDLILIRSQAISTNSNYRINFLSVNTWKIEVDDGGSWVDSSDTKNLPPSIVLTEDAFNNAGDNLEASSRGIFEFNGASGSPFVTLEHEDTGRSRSINVAIGGAIEKVSS